MCIRDSTELARLLECIENNKTTILDGKLPLLVDGYCNSCLLYTSHRHGRVCRSGVRGKRQHHQASRMACRLWPVSYTHLHQQADFVFGQETACRFLLLDFILPEPVSYTHLDVYKRQAPCRAGHIRATGRNCHPRGHRWRIRFRQVAAASG